jgi:hypothetical protein
MRGGLRSEGVDWVMDGDARASISTGIQREGKGQGQRGHGWLCSVALQAGGAGGSTARYSSTPGHSHTGLRRANTRQQWISYEPHGVFQQLPRLPQGVCQCRLFGACMGGYSTKEVRFCV